MIIVTHDEYHYKLFFSMDAFPYCGQNLQKNTKNKFEKLKIQYYINQLLQLTTN